MAGLTENGFEIKTEEDVLTDLRAEVDAQWGAVNGAKLATGPLGTIVNLISRIAAALWLLGLAVYNSQNPNTAFGVLLDHVLELSGLIREVAATSTSYVVAIGTNGTVLSVGRRIRNAVTLTYWTSTEEATIATLSAWTISTAYAVNDLATNDSGKIYACVEAGTSAGSGGPTGSGSADIVDGTASWRYCGTGTAAVIVPIESELEGAIVGAAGDLTTIETPVGGWSSVVNPLDAELGRETETDAALRIRRNALLRATGNAALDAIVGDVLDVADVERVVCFKNDTDETDSDGVPPHSVEVLVRGGTDADIAAALLATVAAGIRTYGTETVVVEDSQGESQTIMFSRASVVNAYIEVDVVIDADDFPVDGDDQIKQAFVDFSEGIEVGGFTFTYGLLDIGDDVEPDLLRTPPKQISGVTKVSALRLGTAPSPVGTTTVTITNRQLADIDTSRITVTHV